VALQVVQSGLADLAEKHKTAKFQSGAARQESWTARPGHLDNYFVHRVAAARSTRDRPGTPT